MPEKLKEILGKIKEWWGKFTARQRTIIIAIAAVVIFTLVIIVYVISRPKYIKLELRLRRLRWLLFWKMRE